MNIGRIGLGVTALVVILAATPAQAQLNNEAWQFRVRNNGVAENLAITMKQLKEQRRTDPSAPTTNYYFPSVSPGAPANSPAASNLNDISTLLQQGGLAEVPMGTTQGNPTNPSASAPAAPPNTPVPQTASALPGNTAATTATTTPARGGSVGQASSGAAINSNPFRLR